MLLSRNGIRRAIEAERPDIIEVGDPYRSAWITAGMAREMGIPVVAFYHSDYPRDLARTFKRFGGRPAEIAFTKMVSTYLLGLYRRMEATVVATKRLLTILSDMGIPRLVHIPLGTNPDVFYPRNCRQEVFSELGFPESSKLLLFVGRLAREKNIRELARMLDRLPDHLDCRLLMIGDGEQRRFIQREAGRRKNLVWLSYCGERERLARFYSSADLFLCPGTSETFGLASLEAQACGTRALAVRGGGADETLAGEDPLIMAASAKPGDLAEAAARSLSIAETADSRAWRSRRIAESFSLNRTFTNLVSVYERLCGKEYPPRRRRSGLAR